MHLIRLIALLALLFSPVTTSASVAEDSSWDIGEFDSCFGLTTEEREKLLGSSMEAWWRHYEYCCIKSGGRMSHNKCVAPGTAPSSASATPLSVKPMQDSPSEGILKNACARVKGIFGSNESGFACTKTNCDGNGGHCTVACVERACVAFTPSPLTKPASLVGILQNGDNKPRDDEAHDLPEKGAPEAPPAILY